MVVFGFWWSFRLDQRGSWLISEEKSDDYVSSRFSNDYFFGMSYCIQVILYFVWRRVRLYSSTYTIQSQILSNVLLVPPGLLNAVDPLSALNQ